MPNGSTQHPAQNWLTERLAETARIAGEMVALGASPDHAKAAASVYLMFPTDPHHGVDAIEDGSARSGAIIAIRDWLAAQAHRVAA